MKKSEFIKSLYGHLDRMFDYVSDSTKVGTMFSKDSKNISFTQNDFKTFLKSEYLNNHLRVFDRFSTKQGDNIDKESFFNEASLELLNHFKTRKITKDKTFLEAFPYETASNPAYFREIATVITNVLEKYGRPPLFHKTQDKVIKYDWESEVLTINEVYEKLERTKKLKSIFVLAKDKGNPCLKAQLSKVQDLDVLEDDIRKFLKNIDGWWIYVPNKKSVMIINY